MSTKEEYIKYIIITTVVFRFLIIPRITNNILLFTILLPGTIVHETLHFLVGLFTFSAPIGYTVIPKKYNNGWVLGSVKCINLREWNAPLVSMAPLLSIFIPWLTTEYYWHTVNESIGIYILSILLISIILNSSIPSQKDVMVSLHFWKGSIMYIAVLLMYINHVTEGYLFYVIREWIERGYSIFYE